MNRHGPMDFARDVRGYIYGRYGHEFQGTHELCDGNAAKRWARVCDWWWLWSGSRSGLQLWNPAETGAMRVGADEGVSDRRRLWLERC